ncbi:hypothetical protein NPIL_597791 [Nephila pilipes]|uniref:Uncharacterized protein n=1 Tax=Nephila pilipes TaxID=299642 RepID=A0A8X6P9K0_NEPPI|nr:hypothetical protein NPIL_597791 [Nephila pilipes]
MSTKLMTKTKDQFPDENSDSEESNRNKLLLVAKGNVIEQLNLEIEKENLNELETEIESCQECSPNLILKQVFFFLSKSSIKLPKIRSSGF